MLLEHFLMFEPPKGARDKHDELGPVLPHALKLGNSGGILFGGTPIVTFFFEKRQGGCHWQRGSEVLFINQNEGNIRREQFPDGLARLGRSGNVRFVLISAKLQLWCSRRKEDSQQNIAIDSFGLGCAGSTQIGCRPEASMPFQFVAAEVLLSRLIFRCADNHGLVRLCPRVSEHLEALGFLEMFEHITQKNEIIIWQGLN